MYGAMKRHEIQVRRKAGQSHAEIARDAGVSARTSKRVASEAEVTGDAAPARQRPGRPSKVEGHRAFVAAVLAKEPDLATLEVLHRARQVGYEGGKSALYELVRELRPTRTMPMVRFEGLPGEFSQHDFGVVDVRYVGGGEERITFFASRLKHSRWAAVQITVDQRVESLVRALHRHPRSWYGEVEILFDLLETFGQDKLRDALRVAVEQRQFAALYVTSLLDRQVV